MSDDELVAAFAEARVIDPTRSGAEATAAWRKPTPAEAERMAQVVQSLDRERGRRELVVALGRVKWLRDPDVVAIVGEIQGAGLLVLPPPVADEQRRAFVEAAVGPAPTETTSGAEPHAVVIDTSPDPEGAIETEVSRAHNTLYLGREGGQR